MRIALLAHALRVGGGMFRGKNLIAGLGRIAPGENYLVTIPGGLGYETACRSLPHGEFISLPKERTRLQRWRFDRYLLPEVLSRFQPDVVVGLGSLGYHGRTHFPQAIFFNNPCLIYPRRNFGPTVTAGELLDNYLRRKVFSGDLKRTGLLFTQTRTVKDRIRRLYGYHGKCVTLSNAVSEFIRGDGPDEIPPEMLKPFSDYFKLFYLTKYYSHKNIEMLVDLFDRFRKELKQVVLFITVSEDQHPAVKKLLASIRRKKLDGSIINLGPIPQSELADYYLRMDALLMPTLMESFSVSYLEAMHFGVPILTSDLDFAHEVCGAAACYFDPWKADSIMATISRLRNDPRLADSLVEDGRKRLEESFVGWDEIAGRFLKYLRELAGKKEM